VLADGCGIASKDAGKHQGQETPVRGDVIGQEIRAHRGTLLGRIEKFDLQTGFTRHKGRGPACAVLIRPRFGVRSDVEALKIAFLAEKSLDRRAIIVFRSANCSFLR
jgi:hypothetical protein